MTVSVLPAALDLTNLDADMSFARLVELIGSVYPWLDLDSRAEVARLHLEAMAHLAGHFHFYMNRIGRESRWGTAVERTHLIAAAKLVGYRPKTATASSTSETFILASAMPGSVVIPAGTTVTTPTTPTPVAFQLLADLVIAAGQTTTTAVVEHSTTQTEVYVSDGTPFQRFRLASSPYLDGSMLISTALGTWTEVSNFLKSGPNDRVFVTQVDSQDRVTVIFGNNRTGSIPGSPITFTYKTGGGASGVLPAAALTVLAGSWADDQGNVATISVTNPSATSPASDRESESAIQQNAPASIAVAGRAVARSDYEQIARSIPGVAFALMLTRNESPAVLENEGFLFIVPTDGSVAGSPLLTLVASQFGDAVAVGSSGVYVSLPVGPTPKTTTFQLRVRPATYKRIDLYVKAFLRRGYSAAAVGPAIEAAFRAFFSVMVPSSTTGSLIPNPRINFGYYLQDVDGVPTGHFPISTIESLVASVAGVREIGDQPTDLALNGVARNVDLGAYEFPVAGDVTYLLA